MYHSFVNETVYKLGTELGPPLGMDLNLKKNELVFFDSCDSEDSFPAICTRFKNNFELLGSPIGDATHCTQFVNRFVDKTSGTLPAGSAASR